MVSLRKGTYHVDEPLPVLLMAYEGLQHVDRLELRLLEDRRRPSFHEKDLQEQFGPCMNGHHLSQPSGRHITRQ